MDQGQAFQHWVEAGDWFAASVAEPGGFALVGCTVAPGFEFADFELAEKNTLLDLFPNHNKIINEYCKR